MSERLTIAVLTTGRQDYGILRSTIHALFACDELLPLVWCGGMHLHPRFGRTIQLIQEDRIHVDRELPFIVDPPDPFKDLSRAVTLLGEALDSTRPDALLLVGDRIETLAAATAATLARVPIVHLHGGEETEGAIDNACRHAITKLSHLHLVSHPEHQRRIVQMGEPSERVVVVGVPAADNMFRLDLPDRSALQRELGVPLSPPLVLVTLHPTTLENKPSEELKALTDALEQLPATYLITLPNADPGGDEIAEAWQSWAAGRPRVYIVPSVGERRYWALLRIVDAVVGNSSSGIIEAPLAGAPVVNIGDRQKGRLRFGSVVDVPSDASQILDAIRNALGSKTSGPPSSGGPSDVIPSGPAAPRIVAALQNWAPKRSLRKPFCDLICEPN